MSKVLICTGYAVAGVAGVFAFCCMVAVLMFANWVAGGYLLEWSGFAITENSQSGLMAALFMVEIGLFLGAMICKENQ